MLLTQENAFKPCTEQDAVTGSCPTPAASLRTAPTPGCASGSTHPAWPRSGQALPQPSEVRVLVPQGLASKHVAVAAKTQLSLHPSVQGGKYLEIKGCPLHCRQVRVLLYTCLESKS